jgi:hypothetical protein
MKNIDLEQCSPVNPVNAGSLCKAGLDLLPYKMGCTLQRSLSALEQVQLVREQTEMATAG